jgi:hypothetical protein
MTEADITKIYSGPVQGGGDLPYFVGKQYGNGWLRTLGRFAFPILRRVLGVAMKTGDDIVNDRKDWKSSIRDNAKAEMDNYMQGRGVKRRATTINTSSKDPISSIFAKRGRRRQ